MGFPIREIVLATNANRVIEDYLEQGLYQPRQSVSTLANAMDVGHPSNFERLQYLLGSFENFKKNVQAVSVSDDEIKKTITKIYQQYQMIICPHTATGCFARQQLSDQHWIVVATADPAKFDNIIEPIIQRKVPITVQLQSLLDRPTHKTEIEASLEAVKNICQK